MRVYSNTYYLFIGSRYMDKKVIIKSIAFILFFAVYCFVESRR